jgi:hypothetical protein
MRRWRQWLESANDTAARGGHPDGSLASAIEDSSEKGLSLKKLLEAAIGATTREWQSPDVLGHSLLARADASANQERTVVFNRGGV